MDTFSTNTVLDRISNLSNQIMAIFSSFIQHTKYFFINNMNNIYNATIQVPGNIYLLSDTNMIILNNNIHIVHGNILPTNIDDYTNGSLFISTVDGDLYIKKIINDNATWCKIATVP